MLLKKQNKMKVVVVGGVAGGATTVARIRRMSEQTEIVLLEKGKYISYANCGLPYYIGGVIEERDKLFVQTPESFSRRFNIDVRVESEVVQINRERKTVTVRQKTGERYEESYDKLILSTGALPIRPSLPGIDMEGIFTLRNVEDTDRIKTFITEHNIKKAVVVGGGFIGLEMAENLHRLGADVSVVEMGNQVMTPIDYSMASFVHRHLLEKGVNLYLEETVFAFEKGEGDINIRFTSGKTVSADMVLLSVGVRPSAGLAKEAGIQTGETGGIVVNDYLQTSDESIYAIGDVIEFRHPVTGKPWLNYLAGPANRQGRIAADNIVLGNSSKYEGAIGTAIAKVFDLTVASAGLPAKRLKQENIPYVSSTTQSSSHAGYYPDALSLTIKITFDKTTGRLYGGQIVGYDGVDKRMDEIALIIKHKGTIYDLMELEQAYAPPFSSAKDPVAIAGYTAQNILSGRMNPFYWRDIPSFNADNTFLLDVRTSDEFQSGAIPQAINIPLDDLRNRLDEIPKDKTVYVYCAAGLRGYIAARVLTQQGYQGVRNLSGGYNLYKTATAAIPPPAATHGNDKDRTSDKYVPTPVESMVKTVKVDACGLQCPGPILKLKKTMDALHVGERAEIISTDPGFLPDAEAWCRTTGHQLISGTTEKGKSTVVIGKSDTACFDSKRAAVAGGNKTFIVFSDDLDKALAAFVLANGAAATGRKVTLFFTFWGLNVIKKEHKPKVKKDIPGNMFGWMLPSSSLKLRLSKMNMWGIGSKMMRYIMRTKGIDSLESLRRQALENGVEFIACQMSMDVMGVKREELLDEVTIGGVATYMERADQANVNLFI